MCKDSWYVDSWKERLSEIVSGYKKEDIGNMDESGAFWRALPGKGFGEKGKGVREASSLRSG